MAGWGGGQPQGEGCTEAVTSAVKSRAFLWNGCPRVHRTLNCESATAGPPLPRGPRDGTV